MNTQLVAKYLQFLRKQKGYTQENLATKLSISRQAVSKWETGNTLPDLDSLLKLSQLYEITINEILEPKNNIISHGNREYIENFEQIIEVGYNEIKEVLLYFSKKEIVKASIGGSPQVNKFLIDLLPEINFNEEWEKIGCIQVEEVEKIHNEIVSFFNLLKTLQNKI